MRTTLSAPSRRRLAQLVRYASVSAVSTATGLLVLGVLVGGLSFSSVWANVIATGVGTVPSFELNRRWVWRHTGRLRLGQLLAFCALSFAGLVVSTLAVHLAAAATAQADRLVHTMAVELANLSAYGALWIVQFVLCDRLLFGRHRPVAPGPLPETGAAREAPVSGARETCTGRVLESADA